MSDNTKLDKNGFLPSLDPKKSPLNLFVVVVALSAMIYTVIYFIIGNGQFADVFFIRCADFYMDFFNSIRDAAQGSEAYTKHYVIYPPMANLIYLALSRFTPDYYNDTSFAERYTWSEYFSTMMLVVMFTAALAIILFFIMYTALKENSRSRKFLFSFFAFFSVPVLYLVERGNIIFITLIALMIYAFTYNSKNKRHRELGLICLAFAFSIKLYPVVFGWFLIADKRFKEALRCVIYGVLMIIVPSFFFGGPVCLYWIIQNIIYFSSVGSGDTLSHILDFIHMPEIGQTIVNKLVYIWVFICACAFAVSPFIRKEKAWKTYIIGLLTINCIPSLTSLYTWAFFLIPLIMLCNQKERWNRCDRPYVIMMIIPFIFLPFRISFRVSPNIVLMYVMTAVMSVFAVIDTVRELRAFVKVKKSEGVTLRGYIKSLVKN